MAGQLGPNACLGLGNQAGRFVVFFAFSFSSPYSLGLLWRNLSDATGRLIRLRERLRLLSVTSALVPFPRCLRVPEQLSFCCFLGSDENACVLGSLTLSSESCYVPCKCDVHTSSWKVVLSSFHTLLPISLAAVAMPAFDGPNESALSLTAAPCRLFRYRETPTST